MVSLLFLITATVLYAGYNLFIKVSGSHVPPEATTIVVGTICLQLAALTTSIVFASILLVRGGHVFQLSLGTYVWATAAGLCIGGAEIAYFYLFGGIGVENPMAASIAIPTIVSGTIIITMVAAAFLYQRSLIMTHRDGLPRFSARSVRRRDAGHRKTCATTSESFGQPPFWSRMRPVGGRRNALTMHRIARGLSPTRQTAYAISMSHYQ